MKCCFIHLNLVSSEYVSLYVIKKTICLSYFLLCLRVDSSCTEIDLHHGFYSCVQYFCIHVVDMYF